jgi:hypothetical protein
MPYALTPQLFAIRRTGTPLVAIQTPDPQATAQTITQVLTAKGPLAILHWDGAAGVRGLTREGLDLLALLPCAQDRYAQADPRTLLTELADLHGDFVVLAHTLHKALHDPAVVQAVCNLRDRFKAQGATLILLCPTVTLPAELTGDVVLLDEPLPDAEALEGIVRDCLQATALDPVPEDLTRAVDILRGLSAFSAEQETAMALTRHGLDLTRLWDRKRRKIADTPGLAVTCGTETFASVGGCEAAKTFFTRVLSGKRPPRAVVWLDEIEKTFAGAAGDLSGIAQDALGTILTHMQDREAQGSIFLGPPGSGKSLLAKAIGNEARVPTIQLDLGAAKSSLVGESEARLRQALKVIDAISDGQALWVATSNNISGLPPELKRRFSLPTFMFDLPTAEERLAIWTLYTSFHGLTDAPDSYPDDTGWSGADIARCCNLAWQLDLPLPQAAAYIVPIGVSAKDQIDRLRTDASGKYSSASTPGVYRAPLPEQGRRKVQWEGEE